MNEPAYPIFFPTYSPVANGYVRDWWWYDPTLGTEDTGPFVSRSEAVADWAFEHLGNSLVLESQALEQALGSPLLQAPATSRLQPIHVLPEWRRSLLEQQDLSLDALHLYGQLEALQALEADYGPDFGPLTLLEEVSA